MRFPSVLTYFALHPEWSGTPDPATWQGKPRCHSRSETAAGDVVAGKSCVNEVLDAQQRPQGAFRWRRLAVADDRLKGVREALRQLDAAEAKRLAQRKRKADKLKTRNWKRICARSGYRRRLVMAKPSELEQAVENLLDAMAEEGEALSRKRQALRELVTRPHPPARVQSSQEIQAYVDEQGPVRISGGSDFGA